MPRREKESHSSAAKTSLVAVAAALAAVTWSSRAVVLDRRHLPQGARGAPAALSSAGRARSRCTGCRAAPVHSAGMALTEAAPPQTEELPWWKRGLAFDEHSQAHGLMQNQDHAWRCLQQLNDLKSGAAAADGLDADAVLDVMRLGVRLDERLAGQWFKGDSLIDRIARAVAKRRCLKVKELCESLEFYTLVATVSQAWSSPPWTGRSRT
eukprot:TRINITY_DN70803_c0_g1_i1.p1 TRINITY_DN70803_c0_g1~~TRINITY_DN70803_c0_g1_i1.p1  ORF type:complete len:210 (+),score=52.97 TRINITY_DN70803_c0_g1_i1:42-671(+)